MNKRADEKERGAAKTGPVWRRVVRGGMGVPLFAEGGRKPAWIRTRLPSGAALQRFEQVAAVVRREGLHTVCEEASCPNVHECFGKGTATFMILGDRCTRRCLFCDVAHGRPSPPDPNEPERLARAAAAMGLRYVVVTSVDRDDLPDGGAGHFAACVRALRREMPEVEVEILVPDFRGRMVEALKALAEALPDVFNHNVETVPRLYPAVRPGANYRHSLMLLAEFKERFPEVVTKSGVMVGLGEHDEELYQVLADLRAHGVEMVTVGQYLAPSPDHWPVARFVSPQEFEVYTQWAKELGFRFAACGPLVRSSYFAEEQATAAGVRERREETVRP